MLTIYRVSWSHARPNVSQFQLSALSNGDLYGLLRGCAGPRAEQQINYQDLDGQDRPPLDAEQLKCHGGLPSYIAARFCLSETGIAAWLWIEPGVAEDSA